MHAMIGHIAWLPLQVWFAIWAFLGTATDRSTMEETDLGITN